MLELFADDRNVKLQDEALAADPQHAEPAALIEFAWQLRQRDRARALDLAARVEAASSSESSAAAGGLRARIALLRAEVHWESGEFRDAERLNADAEAGFAAVDDALGLCDSAWLAWSIASKLGSPDDQQQLARKVEDLARRAGDPVRRAACDARSAFFLAFADPLAARARYERQSMEGLAHPVVAAFRHGAAGVVETLQGNPVAAARAFLQSYQSAMACGCLSLASNSASNAAESFVRLSDIAGALEWSENSLQMARRIASPLRMGHALVMIADCLRQLERYAEARARLDEALQMMSQFPGTAIGWAVSVAGELAQGEGNDAEALRWFEKFEEDARQSGMVEYQATSLCRQAGVLRRMGRLDRARLKSRAALALADQHNNPVWQVSALQVIAETHEADAGQGGEASREALQCLERALALAGRTEGFLAPPELFDEAARASAACGDHARAYALAVEARAASARIHNKEATDRASAMQVRFEVEQLKAEAERQQRLVAARQESIDALQQANATLEELGAIGREITANLQSDAILRALDEHVHALLDAFYFCIYRLHDDGETVTPLFSVEDGRAVPIATHKLRPNGPGRRCIRELHAVIESSEPGSGKPLPGTAECLSEMWAPLRVGGRVLGMMTIQSPRRNAYGERELAIFRNLCAYGAIAIANAETQAQMIQTEKLASLGQLVANVGHEINTPIAAIKSRGQSMVQALGALRESEEAFCAVDPDVRASFVDLVYPSAAKVEMMSNREERTAVHELTRHLAADGVDKPRGIAQVLVALGVTAVDANVLRIVRHPEHAMLLDRARAIATLAGGVAGINMAVDRVGKIVNALKSYSRRGDGEFAMADPREGLETVLSIYHSRIKHGIELVLRLSDVPRIRCLPDELNQVWTNLIHNALQAMQNAGTLTIAMDHVGDDVVVRIGDSGCGIPPAIRERIFEPFFTTKPAGEGSGLGLDIVRKIVEKHRGRIDFESTVGVGTTFTVRLPTAGAA